MAGGGCYQNQMANPLAVGAPEDRLAKLLLDDLGVSVNPQALRMFVRWRWEQISPLAHKIHGS